MKNIVRTHLISFIWLVTTIDIWCCQFLVGQAKVFPPSSDFADELNPLARIILVNFGVWAMVACKVFGTFIVTEWLRHLPLYFSVIIALVMLTLVLTLAGVIPV